MTKRRFFSRDDILQASDLATEEIYVPEWNGWVRVRAITGSERDAYEASLVQRKGKKTELNPSNMRAKLIALSVVDEEGRRLFTDTDVEALGKKSGAALDRVFAVAQRLSGLRDEDMEELAGNSGSDQSGDSTSA